MRNRRDGLILTNNPLVRELLGEEYRVDYREVGIRELLVAARDLVYAGHALLTHPLSGSVKPNETPYKSVLLSAAAGPPDAESALLAASAVETCDKLAPRSFAMTEALREDFQLIDYTLLCGALDCDAAAGLARRHKSRSSSYPNH